MGADLEGAIKIMFGLLSATRFRFLILLAEWMTFPVKTAPAMRRIIYL